MFISTVYGSFDVVFAMTLPITKHKIYYNRVTDGMVTKDRILQINVDHRFALHTRNTPTLRSSDHEPGSPVPPPVTVTATALSRRSPP